MRDRPPVVAAWDAGVDSTAMIVELDDRAARIQAALPLEQRAPMGRWLDDFHRATAALERSPHHV